MLTAIKTMPALYQLRLFDKEKDYDLVSSWWQGHNWSSVPAVMLPQLGVVASADENPVAAGWLYMDNSSGVCMLEWLVTDPAAPAMKAVKGLTHICRYLSGQAKDFGYTSMLTTCRQDSLAKFHERNGFTRTDGEMIHLVKAL